MPSLPSPTVRAQTLVDSQKVFTRKYLCSDQEWILHLLHNILQPQIPLKYLSDEKDCVSLNTEKPSYTQMYVFEASWSSEGCAAVVLIPELIRLRNVTKFSAASEARVTGITWYNYQGSPDHYNTEA